MSVFVGIDCGGSSCRVLAQDEKGEVLFQGQSGAANLVSTPEARLRRNLAQSVDGCPPPDYVCGCFAGLISPAMRIRALDLLRGLFPGAKLRAEPDYTAAFYASSPDTNLCVIAGTGSLVCSQGPEGMVKSGGRGYVLGDLGSGYHYGRDALLRFLDHPDNCSPRLRSEVLRLFGTADENDIITIVYRSGAPATQLAKLMKALGADARDGEPYAQESLRRNTGELVDVVVRHVDRFLPQDAVLRASLAGGVWKAASEFREEFSNQMNERLPGRVARIEKVSQPPLYGAIRLAKEMRVEH